MAVLVSSGLSAKLRTEVIRKKALETIEQSLVMDKLAMKVSFEKREGKRIQFYAYDRLAASTTALTEGVAPAEGSLTVTSLTADLAQYGAWVKISDWAEDILVSSPLEAARERLSAQAAKTIDTLIRDALDTGLPNQFANGEASLAAVGSSDVLTGKEFLKAYVTLQKNDVPFFDSMSYKAVIHPAAHGDLMNDTNLGSFNDVFKYGMSQKFEKNEIGQIYGCRIMESSIVSSTTAGTEGSATVYSMPVVGKDAVAMVALDGRNFEIAIKPPEKQLSDPLGQVGFVSWKIHGFVAKYLGAVGANPNLGVRIRAGSQY